MSEKTLSNIRIVNKHDTEANWLKATGFTPKQGELIVYDIDDNYSYERIKIGDGVQNVNDLPFATDSMFVVNVKNSGGKSISTSYIADKTFDEILTAYNNKKNIYCYCNYLIIPLVYINENYGAIFEIVDSDVMVTHYSVTISIDASVTVKTSHLQLDEDSNLQTEDKTIVGAINEIKIKSDGIDNAVMYHVNQNLSETYKNIARTNIGAAKIDDVNNLSTLVGDTAVADQISSAIDSHEHSWNDLTDKPFGEEIELVEILSEQIITDNGTLPNMSFFQFDNIIIEEGKTYKIIIDGKSYVSAAAKVENQSTSSVQIYIMNENGDGTFTGDEFYFYYDVKFGTSSLMWSKDRPSITLKVYEREIDVFQLDDKYIPNTIARVSDVENLIDAIPTPDVSGQIETHNTSETAHSDIRESVNNLNTLVGDVAVSEQIGDAFLNNQGDWWQNDSNQANYIKNRPFYSEDPVEEPVLASTSLDFNGDDAYFGDFSVSIETELLQEIEPGVEYIVTFDGTEYRRTAFIDRFRVVIGNAAFIAGTDTGEPFAIDTHGGLYADICVDHSNRTVHTFSIIAVEETVHKIDMKYIPDCLIPKTTYVELVESEWIEDESLWYQVVNINGVTVNSKIDLQPTAYQILDIQNKDISFIAENDDGVVTVYCFGNKPDKSYSMQVLITEVLPI